MGYYIKVINSYSSKIIARLSKCHYKDMCPRLNQSQGIKKIGEACYALHHESLTRKQNW